MRPEPTCETARELAAEVALGIASGEERAAVLAHVARCAPCSQHLVELSRAADALLTLAPELPPPPDLERRVLARLRRPRRLRRAALAAAALLAALALGAGAMWAATGAQRWEAGRYREVLALAEGTWYGVWPLRAPAPGGERDGYVFLYRGQPSWLFVVAGEGDGEPYDVVAVTADGRRVTLGTMAPDRRSWGATTSLDLRTLEQLLLVDEEGRVALAASRAASAPAATRPGGD
ncbi:MAG TPA: zf-HC2 domain-containing protein [Actinomycetota bacterium]|nr:zf-HC2 domain-containing protein [Actinomycetota bacterium]